MRFGFYIYNQEVNSDALSFFRKYVIIEEIISSIFSLSIFIYSYKIYKTVKESKKQSNVTSYDDLNWIRVFFRLGFVSFP